MYYIELEKWAESETFAFFYVFLTENLQSLFSTSAAPYSLDLIRNGKWH